MKRATFLKTSVLLAIAVMIACIATAEQEKEQGMLVPVKSFFAYDKKLPLMAEAEIIEETNTFGKYHVKYFSVHGQFVPAILTLPKGTEPPYTAVIFQHGMGGHKESEGLINFGTGELVKNGYAVISIDAAMHGERKTALSRDKHESVLINYPYVMRDMFVQTVIDVRRAVDYLQERDDIDGDRIYYIGISMGSIQGVLVTAVEKRIKGLITVVGGGNFTECNPLYKAMPSKKDLLDIMEPTNFVKEISPRPILMLNGEKDPLVPPACARALFEAAGEPKEQVFYDTKHNIPLEEGMEKVINWLNERSSE
ncbi:MAG: alpha/beta fold hydrolase [bacterium]